MSALIRKATNLVVINFFIMDVVAFFTPLLIIKLIQRPVILYMYIYKSTLISILNIYV